MTTMRSSIFKFSTLVFLLILLCTFSTGVFACSLCASTCIHGDLEHHHSDTVIWSTKSSHPPTCDCAAHQKALTCSKRLHRDNLSDAGPLPAEHFPSGMEQFDNTSAVSFSDIPIFTSLTLKIHRTVVLRN